MAYEHSLSRILFFIFVFVLVVFYYIFSANPFGIMKHFRIPVMILCLITVFGFLIFIEYYTKQQNYKADTISELGENFMKYAYKYFFYLFYFLVISVLGYFIYKSVEKGILLTFQYSFWVTMGLVILLLALFSQMTQKIHFDSPSLELLKTLIMYIPCLITDAIEFIKKDYENTPSTVFIVFLVLLVYIFLFYFLPFLRKVQYDNDGVLLLDSPSYLNQDVLAITSDELKEKILNQRPFYDKWFQRWSMKKEEEKEQKKNSYPIQLEGKTSGDSITLIVPPDKITYPYYEKAIESFTSIVDKDAQFISLDVFKRRINDVYGSSMKDAFSDETAEERMNAFIRDHPQILTLLEKLNYIYSVLFASWDTLVYSPLLLLPEEKLIPKNIYHYALTSWVYFQEIESRDMQLIYSFGSRPSLYYDPVQSVLMVIMNYGQPEQRILYKTDQILYQRWNFIVMNYNYGTLDLFINNNLVGTYPDVVTYLDPDDMLIVGSSKNKNIGGICNMKYYELPIGSRKINSIYTSFHNKKIPL